MRKGDEGCAGDMWRACRDVHVPDLLAVGERSEGMEERGA